MEPGYLFSVLFMVLGYMVFLLPQPSRRLRFIDRPGWWIIRRVGEFMIMWYVGYVVFILIAFQFMVHEEHYREDLAKVQIYSVLAPFLFAIAMVFAEKWAWTALLTTFTGALLSEFVPITSVLHVTIEIIVVVAVLALFVWWLQSKAAKMMVTLQYSIGIGITVVFSTLFVWKGVRGWIDQTHVNTALTAVAVVLTTTTKVVYTLLYAECIKRNDGFSSIVLDDIDRDIAGSL